MSWQRRFCIFLFLINAHFQGWGFFLKVLVLLFFFFNSDFVQTGADGPLLWKPCLLLKSIKTLIE